MRSIKPRSSLSGATKALAAVTIAAIAPPLADADSDNQETSQLSLGATYTADVFTNVEGGLETGTRYLDNALVSGEMAFGSQNSTDTVLYASLAYNNNSTFSDELVGDAQVVSNIDADSGLRVYEAWVEHTFASGRAGLLGGLFDLNSEFDVIDAASLFINSSHGIGFEIAQTGDNGPSIFPVTALAGRLKWSPTENTVFRIAAIDATAGTAENPSRPSLNLSSSDGALIIAQASLQPNSEFNANLGIWGYTNSPNQGDPLQESSAPLGIYGSVEGTLNSPLQLEQLRGFVRFGLTHGNNVDADGYLGYGLNWQVSPSITAGVASAHAFPSSKSRAIGLDSEETTLEATVEFRLNEKFAIQPNLQYTNNPGFSNDIDNSLALGIRLSATLWE